ncbi:MAG TPA: hypothetical protein VFK76_01370 [Gaiellaceae bacterium]|nr:hypothetical protein [Gaiellaceae bacterium]
MAEMNAKEGSKSAAGDEKDLVTRLADAGEEALQRLVELPGGQRAVSAFNDLRTRVDDLGKKVRGIDALEARVAKLEKQVAELKRSRTSSTPRGSSARKPTT